MKQGYFESLTVVFNGYQQDCRVVIWAKNEVSGGGWSLKVNK